jgi:hypothetical protein
LQIRDRPFRPPLLRIRDRVSREPSCKFVTSLIASAKAGKNGIGAYLANGTNGRLSGTVGPDKEVNLSGGRNYVASRAINATPGPNYFDDIVIWRTQLILMGELNNASCHAPWK